MSQTMPGGAPSGSPPGSPSGPFESFQTDVFEVRGQGDRVVITPLAPGEDPETADARDQAERDAILKQLEEEGRRARERERFKQRLEEIARQQNEATGELSPEERIGAGLLQATRGIADGRANLERLEALAAKQRADLVNGEERARVLATEAMRARLPRARSAGQLEGPRRKESDGRARPPAEGRTITVDPSLHPRQAASLVMLGLAHEPKDDASRARIAPFLLPRATLPARTWLDRFLERVFG